MPANWSVVPAGYLFRREKRTGFDEQPLLSVYRDHGVIPKDSRDDNFNKASEDLGTYQLVEPMDLVINKMKAWQGSLGVSAHRGIVSPAYFVASPTRSFNRRFVHYLLRCTDYSVEYQTRSAGIRVNQWDLDWDGFRRIPVVLPPESDQERIANFLDEKTARIDALIAEKERLVERLRDYQYSYSSHLMTRGMHAETTMVLSSFPELGKVPSHWGIKRLKFLGNVRSGVAKGKDLGERATVSLPYLRVANVQDGYLDLAEVNEIEVPELEAPKYLLRKGDVLMNEGGDNDKLGRGTIWQGQIDPCIHQNHVFAVRLYDTCLAEWVSRFTSTDAARAYFFLRSKQSTNLASINQENVRELPVPMPPADERAAILAELQRSSAATADLLEHAIAHIERLREYRSSLISAAVTGQLKIAPKGFTEK